MVLLVHGTTNPEMVTWDVSLFDDGGIYIEQMKMCYGRKYNLVKTISVTVFSILISTTSLEIKVWTAIRTPPLIVPVDR